MQRTQSKVIEHETTDMGKIRQSLLGHVYDFILKAWEATEVLCWGRGELSVMCNQSDSLGSYSGLGEGENELEERQVGIKGNQQKVINKFYP